MRMLCWLAVAFWISGAACPVEAQSRSRSPRIGVLVSGPVESVSGTSPSDPWAKAFLNSLGERGWTDGKDVIILWKSASRDEVPAALDELVQMPVDLLVVSFSFAAVEAIKKTRRIPIIVRYAYSPVDAGLAESLSRPGDRKSTRLNSSHIQKSRMPSSA